MNEKQKRRLAAIQRQQALVDAAKNGKRQLTAEEEAEMQTLQREIEQLTTEIAAEEEQQRSLGGGGTPPANPTPPVTPPAPTGGQDEGQRQLEADRTRTLNITTMCRDFGIEDADLQRYISVIQNGRKGRCGVEILPGEKLLQEAVVAHAAGVRHPGPLQALNGKVPEGHQWTRKGSLKDFKTHDNNYLAGPIGDFLEVPEGGELKNDKPTDAKLPTRKIKTYGKQFTLSRQAFINDDIDLVTRIPARYAAAARRTINTQCYTILMENKVIYDGKPLFNAAHKNILTTGTGITQAAVQAMILALSTQKDEFDQPIIVRPGKIIVPAGLDFDIYTLFNSPTIHAEGNTQAVNPLYQYRDLQIIADPTINALAGGFGNVMPWFMTANTADSSFIEVDYLNGQEVPTIRRMETPGQLGFVWDIYLDWGINVMDFRGCIKNPGVKINSPLG